MQELKNAIERAVVISKGPLINSLELSLPIVSEIPPDEFSLEAAEKAHILRVLEWMRWDKERTARALKIDEDTLQGKIEKYGLRK